MDADDLRRFRKSSRSLGGRIDCDLGSLGQPHNRFGTRNVCSSIVSRREDAISGHLVHVWARRTVFQRVPISALRDSPERLVLGGGALCFAIFCNALRNRNVSFFLADGLDGWCRAPAGGLCAVPVLFPFAIQFFGGLRMCAGLHFPVCGNKSVRFPGMVVDILGRLACGYRSADEAGIRSGVLCHPLVPPFGALAAAEVLEASCYGRWGDVARNRRVRGRNSVDDLPWRCGVPHARKFDYLADFVLHEDIRQNETRTNGVFADSGRLRGSVVACLRTWPGVAGRVRRLLAEGQEPALACGPNGALFHYRLLLCSILSRLR